MATAVELDNLSSMFEDLGIEAFMIVARLDSIFQPIPTNSRTLQFHNKAEIFSASPNHHLASKTFDNKDVETAFNLIECNRLLVERILNSPSLNDIIRRFKESRSITN